MLTLKSRVKCVDTIRKAFSILMVVVLLLCFMLSTSALVDDNSLAENSLSSVNSMEKSLTKVVKEPKDPLELQSELDELTYEITSLREENVKHFHLPDGTYEAVVYGEPIHRLNDNGEWEEIDNSLYINNGVITTNDSRVKFAKKITGNESLYTLQNGKHKVTIGLTGAKKKVEARVINNAISEDGMSKIQKLMSLDNISYSVIYSDILEGVDLEYIVVSNSIKENIIVKEPAESYIYKFTLDLNGLYAKIDNNSILILDTASDVVVYSIPAPYMYDAAGCESIDAYYNLELLSNGKYEFSLKADENWMNASNRVYPITIDPSLVDIGQNEDTSVSSTAPQKNYGGESSVLLSSSSEVYYKFATPNLPDDVNISSATVKFPYYYDVTSDIYATVGIYSITSSWNEDNVVWNSKPTTASLSFATSNLYAGIATVNSPRYGSFNVTQYVKSWYNDTPNYGFALKRTGGTAASVRFVTKEKMQMYAQLTITYSGTQFAEGIYAIESRGTDNYIKSYYSENMGWVLQDTLHTSAPLSITADLENLFKISYRPTQNDYVIRSMIDSSLVIFPSISNGKPISGRVGVNDAQLSSLYTWKIEYSHGYYYITYTQGNTKYYLRTSSSTNNACLELTTNASDSGVQWLFYNYTANVYEDIELENYLDTIYVGDSNSYRAYMRSTRIGHNGPVSYSVRNKDATGSSTDKATINSSTGELVAYKPGIINLRVTYPGSPWVWLWQITILSLPCSGYEIEYEPSLWNNDSVKLNSNCYNYALNIRNDDSDGYYYFLQPGAISGNSIYELVSVENTYGINHYLIELKNQTQIVECAMSDAESLNITFTPIGKNEVCPEGTYKIALVIDAYDNPYIENNTQWMDVDGAVCLVEQPDEDYHWYRQNSDGTWSHKPGTGEVINYDASGNIIYDPQACNRDYDTTIGINYEIFVGYYAVGITD